MHSKYSINRSHKDGDVGRGGGRGEVQEGEVGHSQWGMKTKKLKT